MIKFFIVLLLSIGLIGCRDNADDLERQNEIKKSLPPGCTISYHGEYPTPERYIPVLIVRCDDFRVVNNIQKYTKDAGTKTASVRTALISYISN